MLSKESSNALPSPLRLGYSPCPNDTFIFHALSRGLVDGFSHPVETFLADVEELNGKAREGSLDVVKVSISAAAELADRYGILRSGGALGRGCGPLVVAREPGDAESLRWKTVAIPGERTTAHLLLQLHGGFQGPRKEMVFHEIMPAVARGEVDAGVVIHEGRFTYASLGLHRVLDLGSWWEEETGLPLPLGGILVKRSLGPQAARIVEEAIRGSLLRARARPEEAWPYVRSHAQEMDPDVIRLHIDTFVNDFSLRMGSEGEEAVTRLLQAACRLKKAPFPSEPLFCRSHPDG